ncbi:MAG: hypothetical protein AAF211_09130 [Myxococcota bacterium]
MRHSPRLVVVLVIGCGSPTTPITPPPPTVPVTDPAASCEATITDVVVEALPNPLARQLVVTLDDAAAVWAVCRPDADAGDALLFESGMLAEVHRIDVTGMYSGDRSQQYDGCALFRSVRQCSGIAERLAFLEGA